MTDTDTAATTATETAEPAEPAQVPQEVVVGVRFHEAARLHHYSADAGSLFVGEYVVVETARGEELARVVTTPDPEEEPRSVPRDVRPILRQATREDRDQAAAARERGEQMVEQLRRIVLRDRLDLYPVAVQLNLNGDEGTGYFQASEHVDFRAAVEEIEQEHGVALHMQQAGPRERAMLVDGYDICGLRLCCASWMTSFPKVGIRTAKTQGLSLNPDSISGVCGRLLCCLTFEHEVYREMRGTLPKLGKRVSTPAGMGKVIKQNILQQYVTIALDDHPERVDVPVDEIGLAVRTEEAPNQALVEEEREREPREREERPRRQRRTQPRDESPPPSEAAATPETASEQEAPPGRRRRRRTVDQDSPPRPAVQPSPRSGDPPARRRKRRPRQVNGPDSSE